MAVYNGGDFLAPQMESIVGQDYRDWILYVRDDGSSDHSLQTIDQYARQDSRIHLIRDAKGNLGASGNFAALMAAAYESGVQYLMFSDQDDVWRQNKVSCQIDAMRQLEKEYPDTPLLVHSDMAVVHATLAQAAPSFMAYLSIHHEQQEPLKVLLAQNFATGCTVLVNRRLLEIALPMPEDALMHDWWLALCAAVFGHIGYIDAPLLKYRQHGGNEIGAKHIGDFLHPLSGKWKQRWLEGRENLFQSMKQAQALADRIHQHDPENPYLSLIETYASLEGVSPMKRVVKLQRLGIHAQANARQALLLSRLLFIPKAKNV